MDWGAITALGCMDATEDFFKYSLYRLKGTFMVFSLRRVLWVQMGTGRSIKVARNKPSFCFESKSIVSSFRLT